MPDQLSNAKLYYFLAIREALLESGDQFYNLDVVHGSILQKHTNVVAGASRVIKSDIFFRICLQDFIKRGWVDSVDDEFASLFVKKNDRLIEAPSLSPEFRKLQDKYESLGASKELWLGTALVSVLDRFDIDELNSILFDINFDANKDINDQVDLEEDNWSPIPLDRNDQQQIQAIEALDRIVEELRGDNGYASTNLEEKTFVQDKLAQAAKRLKEDSQISWMYLNEFVLKPLGILINRFGKASIGVAAQVTKEAFTAWLKSKGINFLDDFFK